MRAPFPIAFAVCILIPGSFEATADDTAHDWLSASAFSGDLMYFQRHRERYRVDEDRYATNLHHRTMQARLDYRSPFAADTFGIDLGVFTAVDLENSGSPDHEINFFPWRD
ncbi:MAG: hypothetical protein LBT71_03615, partial [Azoarcus sp.]|nr:hypothetical protein [Azoarcus sp.]